MAVNTEVLKEVLNTLADRTDGHSRSLIALTAVVMGLVSKVDPDMVIADHVAQQMTKDKNIDLEQIRKLMNALTQTSPSRTGGTGQGA